MAPDDPDVRTVQIQLDLRLRGDEMVGRAAAPGLAQRDFAGWVGLISALDALIDPPPAPDADSR